jgi:hypothetical protein
MFSPTGCKTFVVTCEGCRRVVPSGREEFPFQSIAVDCPLCREKKAVLVCHLRSFSDDLTKAVIEIRQMLPECKVLLVSGDNEAGALLQEAMTRGFKFDLLAMPVHPLILFQTLRSVGTARSPQN